MEYAEQTTVLSLAALRRLRFPDGNGSESTERNVVARTVLAALALAAIERQRANGYSLRSRCDLIPVDDPVYHFLRTANDSTPFTMTLDAADGVFRDAVHHARDVGLPWREKPLTLKPKQALVELVSLSRTLSAAQKEVE